MTTKKKIFTLKPDMTLSSAANMFMLSLFIREECLRAQAIELEIPSNIHQNLSGQDLNTYFSDLLLDSGLTDQKISIRVRDRDHFQLTTH
jgi:hypothetical protein